MASGYKREETVLRKISEIPEAVTSGTRTIKELEIDDVDKIPRKYLTPDRKAIIAEFKSGGSVPGCRWADKIIITSR